MPRLDALTLCFQRFLSVPVEGDRLAAYAEIKGIHEDITALFAAWRADITAGNDVGIDEIRSAIRAFLTTARKRFGGQVLTPLIPFGIAPSLNIHVAGLRYALARRDDPTPCGCASAAATHTPPDPSHLVHGDSNDALWDTWDEYRCTCCGAVWRNVDASTEQISWDRWERIEVP